MELEKGTVDDLSHCSQRIGQLAMVLLDLSCNFVTVNKMSILSVKIEITGLR